MTTKSFQTMTAGVSVKLLFFVSDIPPNKLERFYLTRFFSQPRQYNVRPSYLTKSLQDTNTLTYFGIALMTEKNQTLTEGVSVTTFLCQ
jgi:hypothetical protein